MEYPLTQIFLRLDHATKAINDFRRAEIAFREQATLEMLDIYDPDTRILSAQIGGDSPPREMGLILGDSLHNIRAALDNLLVVMLAKEGKGVQRSHQFPLQVENNSASRKTFSTNVAGIALADRELIAKYQPHTWGNQAAQHPFNKLRVFSNVDKHEMLLPSAMAYEWYLEEGGKIEYLTPVLQTIINKQGELRVTATVNGVENAEIEGSMGFYLDDTSRFWEATLKNVTGEPHFTYSKAPQVSVGFRYEGLQVTHPVLLAIHKMAAEFVVEVGESWGYVIKHTESEL